MKKAIIPIIFALAGTSFVTYSYLDTFVIAKKYDVSYIASNAASNFSFSFKEMESNPVSSSVFSSNSNPNSNSEPSSNMEPEIDDSKYYEDLTKEEIAALFTKETVFIPKQHYSDPDIYVDITSDRFEDYSTYYAADIRIRSLSYLKTAIAHDNPGENYVEKTSDMCNRHKGIIAIDGDTYGSQKNGYVIRNGQVLRSTKNLSRKKPEDLAIYADGTF